tara:strand:+ start:2237 stop:2860 length:624 start_codon:yes stop_codon:yes gene_type:complete
VIFIVDDFYPNPDTIREQALKLQFITGQKKGRPVQHPGARANNPSTFNMLYLRNRFEKITGKQVVYFKHGWSNGAFNLGLNNKRQLFNWVHGDHTTQIDDKYDFWAAVIYLTPNPPRDSGTILLENKETGIYKQHQTEAPIKGDEFRGQFEGSPAADNWHPHVTVENKYNRCIIYRGVYFHAPKLAGFGTNKQNGRLVQLGFWQSEW